MADPIELFELGGLGGLGGRRCSLFYWRSRDKTINPAASRARRTQRSASSRLVPNRAESGLGSILLTASPDEGERSERVLSGISGKYDFYCAPDGIGASIASAI